jgi:hypothetical protein
MGAAQSDEPIEQTKPEQAAAAEPAKPVNAEGRKRLQISQGSNRSFSLLQQSYF